MAGDTNSKVSQGAEKPAAKRPWHAPVLSELDVGNTLMPHGGNKFESGHTDTNKHS